MDCYRSVFLSDLHLGSPWCRARNLLNFLENVTFEKLYLAGDVLDNWHLRRGHRLSRNQLLVWERLLEISRTRDVYYLVGNHDAFLDEGQPYYAVFRQAFAGMHVCRRAIHTAANGKRYLIEHGDAYDAALKSRTLTCAATLCYEVGRNILSRISAATSGRILSPARTEARVLRWQTWFTDFLSDSRNAILAEARRLGLDGAICGHTHLASLQECDGMLYANCGYWTGPCHALLETMDGSFQLRLWGQAWEQADKALEAGQASLQNASSLVAQIGAQLGAQIGSQIGSQVEAHVGARKEKAAQPCPREA